MILMNLTCRRTFLILCLAVSLTACSALVEVKETWRSPKAPPTTYKKLMVIGITKGANLRASFENIFAETLSDHGVAAVPSHTLIGDLGNTDHLQVQAFAQEAGADAVILTRVLTKSENTEYLLATGSVQRRTVIESKQTGDSSTTLMMSGVGIVPGEMDSAGATLQTSLFDAASTNLVWSALSKAAAPDDERMDVVWKLSALLTQALAQDLLIEINSRPFKEPKL